MRRSVTRVMLKSSVLSSMFFIASLGLSAQDGIFKFETNASTELALNKHWAIDLDGEKLSDVHSIAINENKIYVTLNASVTELTNEVTLGCYNIDNGQQLENAVLEINGANIGKMISDGCNGKVMLCNDDAGNVIVTFDSSKEAMSGNVVTIPWYYGVVDFDNASIEVSKVAAPYYHYTDYELQGWGQPAAKGDLKTSNYTIGVLGWTTYRNGADHQFNLLVAKGSYAKAYSGREDEDELIMCSPVSTHSSSPSLDFMCTLGSRCSLSIVNEGGDIFVCNGATTHPIMFQSMESGSDLLSELISSPSIDMQTKGFYAFNHNGEQFALISKGFDNNREWYLAEWGAKLPKLADTFTDWKNSGYKNWMKTFTLVAQIDGEGISEADKNLLQPTSASVKDVVAPTAADPATEPWHLAASCRRNINADDETVTDIVTYAPGSHLAKYRLGTEAAVSVINEVTTDSADEQEVKYFNLQGINFGHQEPDVPGIYIKSIGSKHTKVVIR